MMPEQVLSNETKPAEKPFPWRCPKCRQLTVTRVTMPYRCQRTHNGCVVTVEIPNLAVPRCSNCGELVFDYSADEQIQATFQAQCGLAETATREEESEEQPEKVQIHLRAMREDYSRVTGVPFKHFFCPILLRDEDTRLCMGHIVNEKIPNSCRKTVIQRHDVDGWYGRMFERDFIDFNSLRRSTLEDVLLSKDLRKRIKPRFTTLDGQECGHYPDKGHHAPDQTKATLVTPSGKEVKLILKIQLADLQAVANKKWGMAIESDYRLQALVSMIKAAYLTLFKMLGYRYALSAAGLEVGHYILGRFYLENCGKEPDEVRQEAKRYFSQYVHMLRMMRAPEENLPEGTIENNRLAVCYVGDKPFAAVVCVRTDTARHGVLMPLFEDADTAVQYWHFLQSDRENLLVRYCQFDSENQQWLGRPELVPLAWPKNIETDKLS